MPSPCLCPPSLQGPVEVTPQTSTNQDRHGSLESLAFTQGPFPVPGWFPSSCLSSHWAVAIARTSLSSGGLGSFEEGGQDFLEGPSTRACHAFLEARRDPSPSL